MTMNTNTTAATTDDVRVISNKLLLRMLKNIHESRVRRDSRGDIGTQYLAKAISRTFVEDLTHEEVGRYVRGLVKAGYLRFIDVNGEERFFIDFKELYFDDEGCLVGVAGHTDLSVWERTE